MLFFSKNPKTQRALMLVAVTALTIFSQACNTSRQQFIEIDSHIIHSLNQYLRAEARWTDAIINRDSLQAAESINSMAEVIYSLQDFYTEPISDRDEAYHKQYQILIGELADHISNSFPRLMQLAFVQENEYTTAKNEELVEILMDLDDSTTFKLDTFHYVRRHTFSSFGIDPAKKQ